MEKSKKEVRTLPIVELRLGNFEGGNFIEGHAAVFDSWSETIGGIFPFKEKVRRGAFESSIMSDDIRALFNHDPNYVLGRNKAGTLELREDDQGLLVRIIPPDTSWARDLKTSIERGDITQMSFGFLVEEDNWYTENSIDVRELVRVKLFDVSPVTFPAYTATDVGIRGMERYEEIRNIKRLAENKETEEKELAKEKQRVKFLKTKLKNI